MKNANWIKAKPRNYAVTFLQGSTYYRVHVTLGIIGLVTQKAKDEQGAKWALCTDPRMIEKMKAKVRQ